MQKGVFCCLVVLFFFFSLGVLFLLFGKSPQKGYFPAILEFFLCPQNACLQNPSFLLTLFCFLVLLLSPLSNFILFLWCLSINPFVANICFGVSSVIHFLLPFPMFMFACLFQTNFTNIPFFKLKLLSCLVVSVFLLLFLFLFSYFMCLFFCFYVGFVFGMFFLFCFCCISCLGKHCFPAILVVLSCWFKGNSFFSGSLLLLFVYLVLFVSIVNN